ncbi:MAG: hypothetical protein NT178_15315 [Proteobacteria bacterium]|nr:hypothetical protein [Pseudomonadota bacterium]
MLQKDGNPAKTFREMNYPAATHGVSKVRRQHENHLESSFRV